MVEAEIFLLLLSIFSLKYPILNCILPPACFTKNFSSNLLMKGRSKKTVYIYPVVYRTCHTVEHLSVANMASF